MQTIRPMKNIIIALFLAAALSMALWLSNPKAARAQSDQCLGEGLAAYIETVFEVTSACGLSHVRLLTPAWDMSNNFAYDLIGATQEAGVSWGQFYGVAGTAYDYGDTGVLDQVATFMNGSGLPQSRIFLTEIGKSFSGDDQRLQQDLSQIKTGSAAGFEFLGAAFFSPFPELGGIGQFVLTDQQMQFYCGTGGCTELIGFNSNNYYSLVSDLVYAHANNIPMGTTVSYTGVSLDNPENINSIVRAMSPPNNFTPVVQLIDTPSTIDEELVADAYGQFLCELDNNVNSVVYAVVGPKDPVSEYWYAPGCEDDDATFDLGDNRHPLDFDDGFWLGKYPCDEEAEPEFHPLRPYPATPCDLLIPRSIPEAPESEDLGIWKKYLNYACGTNLKYSTIGSFDPYGRHDYTLVYSDLDINQLNPYQLIICDRSEWDDLLGGPVTCYMTLKFDILMDFSDTSVGILGNTQLTGLTPVLKANNYLAYYWGGVPGIADNQGLDADDEDDLDLIINYTGPIRKLMPDLAQDSIRNVIKGSRFDDIHNYLVIDEEDGPDDGVQGESNDTRIGDIGPDGDRWPNVPLGSLEDVAGEVFFVGVDPGYGVGEDPDTGMTTAPFLFTITCAEGAHEFCGI